MTSAPVAIRASPGRLDRAGLLARRLGIEVCFCASFLAQTKKERGATSGLIHKTAVQINFM
jgi:hypothetical protein